MKFKNSSELTFIHPLDLVNECSRCALRSRLGPESSRINVPQQELTVLGVQGQPTGTAVFQALLWGLRRRSPLVRPGPVDERKGHEYIFHAVPIKRIDGLCGAECSWWLGPLQEHKQGGVKRCHGLSPSAGLKTSPPELRADLSFPSLLRPRLMQPACGPPSDSVRRACPQPRHPCGPAPSPLWCGSRV